MAKSKPQTEPRGNYRFLVLVAAALFFAFLFTTFCFSITMVVGQSMEPLLHEHDWVVVDHRASEKSAILLGDIIVLKKPDVTHQLIIKRVAGLPGDVMEVRAGILYRNRTPVPGGSVNVDRQETMRAVTVPPKCFFVTGDNRRFSNDSRKWQQPFVKQEEVVGKALCRCFPTYRNLQ